MDNFLSLYLKFISFTDLNLQSYLQYLIAVGIDIKFPLSLLIEYFTGIPKFFSDFIHTNVLLLMGGKQKFLENDKLNLAICLAFEV